MKFIITNFIKDLYFKIRRPKVELSKRFDKFDTFHKKGIFYVKFQNGIFILEDKKLRLFIKDKYLYRVKHKLEDRLKYLWDLLNKMEKNNCISDERKEIKKQLESIIRLHVSCGNEYYLTPMGWCNCDTGLPDNFFDNYFFNKNSSLPLPFTNTYLSH